MIRLGAVLAAGAAAFMLAIVAPASGEDGFDPIVMSFQDNSQAGGGYAAEYPGNVEAEFMADCQQPGAPANMCQCAYNRIRWEIPYADYADLDQALRSGGGENHPVMPKLMQITVSCTFNPTQPIPNPAMFIDPNVDYSAEYSPEVRQSFMAECAAPGADPTMCQCALDRIARQMPYADYAELDAQLRAGGGQDHPRMAHVMEITYFCATQPAAP